MDYTVDTAVIGGGPAGLSCGIHLGTLGLSSIVIEKKTYPREKTCAGLVTEKTYELLEKKLGVISGNEQPGSVFCGTCRFAEFYHSYDLLTRSEISGTFRFVKRSSFDAFLAGRYRLSGGILLENSSFSGIDPEQGRLTLEGGGTVSFRHLVVADGALSCARKELGLEKPELGLCVETFIPMSPEKPLDAVRIYFGIAPNGYAWVFPSGGDVCVGIGGSYSGSEKYDSMLRELIGGLDLPHPDPEDCVLKGAFLPYGMYADQKDAPEGVVLIGDAGGLADPIYGEGLYFSLFSGTAAAEAAAKSTAEGTDFNMEYLKRIDPVLKIIREGCFFRKFLFGSRAMKLMKSKLAGRNGFAGFYCDNQVQRYGYSYSDMILKMPADYKKNKKLYNQ